MTENNKYGIYYLTVSVSQESGPSFAECLWPTFSHEVSAKLLAGSEVSFENPTEERFAFKLTHVGPCSSTLID